MDDSSRLKTSSISIALATYNGARYVDAQLQSLARQTLAPLEIVVTDDGSTDNTLDVIEEFARHAPFPLRIYRNEARLGFANNFLKAASLCTGTLIGFCDQDDIWSDDKLSLCSPYFNDPSLLLCVHTAEVWDGEKVTGQLFPGFKETKVHAPSSLDTFALIPGFTMVFRSDLLRIRDNDKRPRNLFSFGLTPLPMAHDQWIWFLATTCGGVATISTSLAKYRQHSSNTYGARKNTGLAHSLTLALNANQYKEIAELEAECSKLALDLSGSLDATMRANAERTARKLSLRSRLHYLRSSIYSPESEALTRCKSFLKIMISGGYMGDGSRAALGMRAAAKDLGLGILRLHKLRAAQK